MMRRSSALSSSFWLIQNIFTKIEKFDGF